MQYRHAARVAVIALALAAFAGCSQPANDMAKSGPVWVGTWGASPMAPGGFGPANAQGNMIENATVRQIVHVSAGGDKVRIVVSNSFGQGDLKIGAAHIAEAGDGAAIKDGTDHILTFGGKPGLMIPAGAVALSDPVPMEVAPLSNLTVSLYFPEATGPATNHQLAVQTGYVSMTGDHTADANFPTNHEVMSRLFLSGVEVEAPAGTKTIIAYGDSITDGAASTPNTNHRWPDYLAARLAKQEGQPAAAVIDEGISGNRVLHDVAGPNAQARYERDVLSWPHGSYIIVLEGINDIGFSALKGNNLFKNSTVDLTAVSADDLIAGYRQLIARAHARGLKIYGATLTPWKGATYYYEDGEKVREAVNQWIRTSGEYDGVVDFDAAVRDPNDPTKYKADLQSGDWLHPNDKGYEAMANAIDLALFK